MKACSMPHADETRTAYLLGALNASATEDFEVHLMGCEACNLGLESSAPIFDALECLGPESLDPLAQSASLADTVGQLLQNARAVFESMMPTQQLALQGMTVRGNTPSSETDTTKLVEGLLEADDSAAAARALRDKRARDETPWPAEALWALGVIERKAGHHGRAREAFEAAVEDAPDHPLYRWGPPSNASNCPGSPTPSPISRH